MVNAPLLSQQRFKTIILLTVCFIIIRLLSLGLYPLFDTTEARYGEIARLMVETGNWVTPLFDYNVPFWGKPPMHTWASALSFSVLGVSEFSARLPHFCAAIATVALTYIFVKRVVNIWAASVSALILISCIGFIVAGGMVMTDAILTFSVALAMICFWQNYTQNSSLYAGLFFFVALSIGMLVKGPIAIVLVGLPLTCWSIANRCLWQAICSLPWLLGLTLFITLTLPWYLLAESATPGFLEYFLWGEHIQRFLDPGWQGDLYGSAHDEVKGTIWLFGLAMAFPWSFVALYYLLKRKTATQQERTNKQKDFSNYLLAWLLAPMVFFTFAGNILPAYVLPSLPAFAIWLALKIRSHQLVITTSLLSLVLTFSALTYVIGGFTSKTSQVSVIGTPKSNATSTIFYWKKQPFSSRFYSNGKAKLLNSQQALTRAIAQKATFILVSRHKDKPEIVDIIKNHCQLSDTVAKYSLFRCN